MIFTFEDLVTVDTLKNYAVSILKTTLYINNVLLKTSLNRGLFLVNKYVRAHL